MSISIQTTILIGAKRVRRLRSPISVSAESAPEGQRGGVHLTPAAAVLDSWVSAASADSSPVQGSVLRFQTPRLLLRRHPNTGKLEGKGSETTQTAR
jgi:hypothetical protein